MDPIKVVHGKLEKIAAAHRNGEDAQTRLQEGDAYTFPTEEGTLMPVWTERQSAPVNVRVIFLDRGEGLIGPYMRLTGPYLFEYKLSERIAFGMGVSKAYKNRKR